MNTDIPIGTKYFRRYPLGNDVECIVEDVHKTYNSKNELVNTEYKIFCDIPPGISAYDYVSRVEIDRALMRKEVTV
jgi:hypothetical protein